jgi:hypothetical protein
MSVRLSLTPSWFLQIPRTNESVSIGVFTTLFPLVGTLTLLNLKLVLLEYCSCSSSLFSRFLTDIGRSHPIGEIRDGKISIIVRFLTYRQRHMVFSKKKELKGHVDKTFITENLTRHRYDLLKRLNTLRVDRKIHSFCTHNGSVLVKETERSRPLAVYNLNINTKYFIYNKRQNI